MNYKQYIKLNTLFESLNSAKQKFDGTDDEFEKLKSLDPTSNKKWKYMDFIVKVGYQDDLKELLRDFEQLSNKGIIKNKDINSYNYEDLKSVVNQSKAITTKTQQKIKIKKDIIKVNDNPLVVIPFTKEASIYYGRETKWCTAYTKSVNLFDKYFFKEDKTLFYILDDRKWAVVFNDSGRLFECRNAIDEEVGFKDIRKNTGLKVEQFEQWFSKNENKIIEAKEKSPITLFKYIKSNNINGTKRMVNNGININITSKYDTTPLHWACLKDNIEIVKILLNSSKQKNVNATDSLNKTPLHFACSNNNYEMAKLLLNNGAQKSINIKSTSDNKTPLIAACKCFDSYKLIKLLLDNGAQKNINLYSTIYESPLYWVRGDQKATDLLKSYGAVEY